MKNKKYKVEIPKGYKVVDTVEYRYREAFPNDSNEHITHITVNLTKSKKELPKTWKELKLTDGYIARKDGTIMKMTPEEQERCVAILWPSIEIAKADWAMRQLIRLRDHYNTTEVESNPYSIYKVGNGFASTNNTRNRGPIVLNSTKLGVEFVKNFRELIIEALPLL